MREEVALKTGDRFSWIWVLVGLVYGLVAAPMASAGEAVAEAPLRFDRDTLAFANETVFVYPHGHAETRPCRSGEEPPAFTLRCFAMCRAVVQFHKFARFDATLPVPDDTTLATLVRRVLRRAVWRKALPSTQRVVIPGYANLRALSKAKPLLVQRHVGGGWTTYLRPGNYRMLAYWWNGPGEQARTQRTLEDSLARHDLFVAYLTSYPSLSINHAVLIYGHQTGAAAGGVRYLVYDPNHPEAPRDIRYAAHSGEFSYQKDWDFVGGKVTVLQVYGRWGQ